MNFETILNALMAAGRQRAVMRVNGLDHCWIPYQRRDRQVQSFQARLLKMWDTATNYSQCSYCGKRNILDGEAILEHIFTCEHRPERKLNGVIEQMASELAAIEEAARGLVEYRRRAGPLNFQLEKADDFINALRIALEMPV